MKRLLSLVILAALLVSATACGFSRTNDLSTPEPTAAAEAAPQQEAVVETPAPEPTPTPEPTPEPLPEPPDVDITDFRFMLANSYNSIGTDYMPPYGGVEGQGIDSRIIEPMMAFMQAVRDAGFTVYYHAIYRSSDYLLNRYRSALNNYYDNDPVETAKHMLAPGVNEHQTGLCVDFTDDPQYASYFGEFDDPYMKDTELYAWLVEHCAEYGFILRYPEGKEAFYGTPCRHAAHFRYVGKEAAAYIMENSLCLEEFLLLYEGNDVYVPGIT
ncbi:MAG: M15 family metallopeptidase [Oscillospiraceae bacterium]|nr:M15 family metallopeptidase [Oscillospiraceae bacterium]